MSTPYVLTVLPDPTSEYGTRVGNARGQFSRVSQDATGSLGVSEFENRLGKRFRRTTPTKGPAVVPVSGLGVGQAALTEEAPTGAPSTETASNETTSTAAP